MLCSVTSSLCPEGSDSGLIWISQTQVQFLPTTFSQESFFRSPAKK